MADRTPRPDATLLSVRGLRTHFFSRQGTVKAVDGLSFDLAPGATLGIAGESGCGKSVTTQSILRIVPKNGAIVDGGILFDSPSQGRVDLVTLDPQGSAIREIRGAEIAMVFQEPMTSFSAMHTIGNQIMEVIMLHQRVTKRQARAEAIEMLERVGMPQPAQTIDSYSFNLSGGMRQRAMIAMALSCRPRLLIADEPTTAVDVTIQAQVLDLIKDLQQELAMALIIITHDLAVIAELADTVLIMYLGLEVESASVDDIFYQPKHPYTRGLLGSVPKLGEGATQKITPIRGSVPTHLERVHGCLFHPRCPDFIPGVCDAACAAAPGRGGGTQRGVLPVRRSARPARAWPRPGRRQRGGRQRRGRRRRRHVMADGKPLLEVRNLKKHFARTRGLRRQVTGIVKAVDDVSFTVHAGETLALVGESGCGKTTTGRCIQRAVEPTAGEVLFHPDGGDAAVNLAELGRRELKEVMTQMGMVFQDPYSSLNPRMTIFQTIAEPLVIHRDAPQPARDGGPRGRVAAHGASGPGLHDTVPARVLRRAAPAHRDREIACAHAEVRRGRRTGVRPGRVGAGTDPGAVAGSPGALPLRLPVHRPQPGGGRVLQRADRRDVRRQDRRADQHPQAVRHAQAPVHGGAVLGGAEARSPLPQQAHPVERGHRRSRGSTVRLLFSSALPLRSTDLQGAGAAAGRSRRGPG